MAKAITPEQWIHPDRRFTLARRMLLSTQTSASDPRIGLDALEYIQLLERLLAGQKVMSAEYKARLDVINDASTNWVKKFAVKPEEAG